MGIGSYIQLAKEDTEAINNLDTTGQQAYFKQTIFSSDKKKYYAIGKHADLKTLQQFDALPDDITSYTIFTTIRNPLDSITSQYQKMVNNKLYSINAPRKSAKKEAEIEYVNKPYSFSHFLHNYPILLQNIVTNQLRFMNQATKTMRFENLKKDFKSILLAAGVKDPPQLKHLNLTKNKKPFRDYYTDKDWGFAVKLCENFLKQHYPHVLNERI